MRGDPEPLLIAHAGGWDEALLLGAPLVVVAGLLFVANRRAKRALGEDDAGGDSTPDQPS